MKGIFQSEKSECALACVAMILGYYGDNVDIASLRREHSLSLKGATLQQLIEIAAHHGLVSRPLRLELNELDKLRLPCILHWELDHFIVLSKVGKKMLTIMDPAVGLRRVSWSEFSRKFTGIALEIFRELSLRRKMRSRQYHSINWLVLFLD